MDEFSLIDQIKQSHYKQSSLVKGIGDDSAIFRQPYKDIVTAVDTFVENVHFSMATMIDKEIGYRSLAATVSDLAAMGAEPKFYLVSIVIPEKWNLDNIRNIFVGMQDFAKIYNMDLIGGDTVSGNELVISITAIGYVHHQRIRYRHSARDGDIVFVTGYLGDSSAGLHILQHNINCKNQEYFVKRHQNPDPKVDFALGLQTIERVTLNDISDGLANELHEIATASKVKIVIDEQKIPLHKDIYQFREKQYKQWAYYGGEDFELVGTVGKSHWKTIQMIAQQTNTMISAIGKVYHPIEHSQEQVFLKTKVSTEEMPKMGYIHLK